MTRFGYTLMTEQSGSRSLVDQARRAEEVAIDFEVMSDHSLPWLGAQGHASYAWSVLGAVAQVTERVADNIPRGPDLDAIDESVSAFWDAGSTDVALVQVGDDRTGQFLDEAAGPLLEALRDSAPPQA